MQGYIKKIGALKRERPEIFSCIEYFFFPRTIDGMTYPGTVKEKEAAQKQYQQAVSKGQTAGLVR